MEYKHRSGVLLLVLLVVGGCAGAWGSPYGVEVSVTPGKATAPGKIVTHVFTVRNVGTQDDLYILELDVPPGWSYFPKQDSIFVPAGGEGYVFVNFIVPPDAPAGTYTVSLRATSTGDPAVSAGASTEIEVLPHRDLELHWLVPPRRLQVGGRDTWAFSLRNTGNVPDIYRIELETYGDWKAEASAQEVHLLPGEEGRAEIRAEVSPRAEPGAGYSLLVVVSSLHDPAVRKELRASGRFLPPPPELVPRSLYPRWDVTLETELDSEGFPRFSFRGAGDIELFDYWVDAGIGVSMEGIEDFRLSWEEEGKRFYLHGGGISGLFLGVSGRPLFGGEIEGLGRWRALFTPDVKGISLTGEGEGTAFNFVWGVDSLAEYSFQDLGFRWSPSDDLSLWGTISQGADAASAGVALQLGGELSRRDFRLRTTYLQVSPGYPRRRLREEVFLRWESLMGSLPFDIQYRFASIGRETPPGRLISRELRASFSPDLPLRPRLELGYIRRFDEPPPRDVDERSLTLRVSLRGEAPFPWNAAFAPSFTEDLAVGATAGELDFSGGMTARAGALELSFSAGVSGALGIGAETVSSFTLRVRFPGAIGSPSLGFQAGGERTRLDLSFRDLPAGEGEVSGSFVYTLEEGESRWEASFSLDLAADFPFLGPTRGRIRGRVFVDRDGDLTFGPGDEGVEGIIIEADGFAAITGDGGLFVFPPLLPGVYGLSFVDLPPELAPAIPLPAVEVRRGEEETVEIPLRPRAWLKGLVFHDLDRDGERDPGEGGIPGVEMAIKGERGEWTVETDATGLFSLELPPGRYAVTLIEESLPERFVPTTPTSLEVEVPEYGLVEVRFGAYRKPKPVVITFGPPIAEIDYAPERPRVGEPVRFSGARSRAFNAEIVAYSWEFRLGDRVIKAQGAEVTVSFPAAGRWTVTLLVTDSNGLIGAKRVAIEVAP